jgi:hypothetical protein
MPTDPPPPRPRAPSAEPGSLPVATARGLQLRAWPPAPSSENDATGPSSADSVASEDPSQAAPSQPPPQPQPSPEVGRGEVPGGEGRMRVEEVRPWADLTFRASFHCFGEPSTQGLSAGA